MFTTGNKVILLFTNLREICFQTHCESPAVVPSAARKRPRHQTT
jgi:hypothetical protein